MECLLFDPKGNTLSLTEVPKPQIESGEVLLRVIKAGICGSDIVAWKGGFKRIAAPVILGHEMVGRIEELHEGYKGNFKMGDRVVVEPLNSCNVCDICKRGSYNVCPELKVLGIDANGCFASFVKVPEIRMHKVPDGLSDERAVMCECVAVAIHMVKRSQLQYGDKVAISGAGPIGLLVGMIAKRAGASQIVISDMNEYRLGLAKELGMDTLNILEADFTDRLTATFAPYGADVSFELVGVAEALNTVLNVTRSHGKVLIAGMFKTIPEVEIQKAILKELTIFGSRVYTFEDFDSALRLLEDPGFEVEKLITIQDSLENAIDNEFMPIKNGRDIVKAIIKL